MAIDLCLHKHLFADDYFGSIHWIFGTQLIRLWWFFKCK